METFKGSAKAKSLLEKMVDYPNVPRKKAKFFNFVRNSFRSYQIADAQLEEIWSVIESFDAKQTTASNANAAPSNDQNLKRKHCDNDSTQLQNSNGKSQSHAENANKKIHSEEHDTNIPDATEATTEFDWIEAIKKICSKQENHQISLCKLQKKVIFVNFLLLFH